MPIKISYCGPYEVPRKLIKKTGGFDIKAIIATMKENVPSNVQGSSGVYIFLCKTKGLEAKYVGVNKTGNLLKEAMGESEPSLQLSFARARYNNVTFPRM